MFVIGILLDALANLLHWIFFFLYILLVFRIIVSWLPVDPYNEIVRVITATTDPILAPFRKMPLTLGVIDFSPMLAFFAIYLLDRVVVETLSRIAVQLVA
jgi:YggT family protein